MTKLISVHEYELKPGADEDQFEAAIVDAIQMGMLQLPGLEDIYFVRGIKGVRQGKFAAIWIYESREAWQRIWGAPEAPLEKAHYPEQWLVWEEEVLTPFLEGDPDRISYTAYEELSPE
jgi:hypothetical protein